MKAVFAVVSLAVLALAGATEVSPCHPLCKFDCTDPICPAVCHPVCERPRCDMQCEETPCAKCKVKCVRPSCEVRCPKDMCELNDCPTCETICRPAECHNECSAPAPVCNPMCVGPKCQWKCQKPEECPHPVCKLKCDVPDCQQAEKKAEGVALIETSIESKCCSCTDFRNLMAAIKGAQNVPESQSGMPSFVQMLDHFRHAAENGEKQCCPCAKETPEELSFLELESSVPAVYSSEFDFGQATMAAPYPSNAAAFNPYAFRQPEPFPVAMAAVDPMVLSPAAMPTKQDSASLLARFAELRPDSELKLSAEKPQASSKEEPADKSDVPLPPVMAKLPPPPAVAASTFSV